MKVNKKILFDTVLILLILIFSIAVSPVTIQNDTFYTIKIGEFVVENGITMQDPFSWHENLRYTFPHWLYDVFIYFCYNIAGMEGIYLSTIFLTFILGLVSFYINKKITKNSVFSFIITMILLYSFKSFIAARAQLVTFILFLLTVFFIEKFLETKQKRYVIGLVIIPIIIANVHIAVWPFYFVLYLPYIAEYLIMCLLDIPKFSRLLYVKFLNKKLSKLSYKEKSLNIRIEEKKLKDKISISEEERENYSEKMDKFLNNLYKIKITKNANTKWLIVIFLVCILTGFCSPLELEPFTYLPKTLMGNTTDVINEHLPTRIIEHEEFLLAVIAFIIILTFTDTKIKLSDLCMLSGLLYLALSSKRQISMFVLIGSIIFCKLFISFIKKYNKKDLSDFTNILSTFPRNIMLLIIILIIGYGSFKPKINEKFFYENTYPVKACDYILANLDVENIKLYNEYNYGSYILFRDIPNFIDSRCDLFTPEYNKGIDIFTDFVNISNINVPYENKFEEYGITHVLIVKNSKLNVAISKDTNYEQLYSDDHFVVYKRDININ